MLEGREREERGGKKKRGREIESQCVGVPPSLNTPDSTAGCEPAPSPSIRPDAHGLCCGILEICL